MHDLIPFANQINELFSNLCILLIYFCLFSFKKKRKEKGMSRKTIRFLKWMYIVQIKKMVKFLKWMYIVIPQKQQNSLIGAANKKMTCKRKYVVCRCLNDMDEENFSNKNSLSPKMDEENSSRKIL